MHHTANGYDTAGSSSESSTLSTNDTQVEVSAHRSMVDSGRNADNGCTSAPWANERNANASKAKATAGITIKAVAAMAINSAANTVGADEISSNVPPVPRLSPRLEMRLALNHDIMDDEDLIGFEPGPKNVAAAILNRDLSTYHRFTGRDLISRTASRVVPKEAVISYSQQKNSKMDTPIPNRKKSNQSTWNNSASVDQSK